MPKPLTGPAGSRHSLMGFFILSFRFPFSCLQLETFPFNLDNSPLFLWPAFKIDRHCDAALQTALDFCVHLFKYLVCLQPRSLRLWIIMFLCCPFSSTQLKSMMKADRRPFGHSPEGRALLFCTPVSSDVYPVAPKEKHLTLLRALNKGSSSHTQNSRAIQFNGNKQ